YRALILGTLGLGLVGLTFYYGARRVLKPFVGGWSQLIRTMDSYDLRHNGPRVVLIGGGIGTAQLIRGFRDLASRLSVIVHMTDEGGSTGRLRRALGTPAFGDIVSNIVALSDSEDLLKQLLLYRFEGDRYGKDTDLGGHKLGNLLFAAMADITGDLNRAIEQVGQVFAVRGQVIPVTQDKVFLRARTVDGLIVEGEEKIDLGDYEGAKILEEIWYEPKEARVDPQAIEAIEQADIIILGPGDLYTTILATVIFPQLAEAMARSQAFKAYITNVANKPFETKGYELDDFIEAFKRHRVERIFDYIFVNSNHEIAIPVSPEYEGYSFVKFNQEAVEAKGYQVVAGDYLESYMGGVEGKGVSIYHDPAKIVQAIMTKYDSIYGKNKS
ncbi:MAG TPA: YvcK family protein, partial [Candidatus Wirthbacteria bacterium]|nr:YvcK family protein [Candidatus Wirthbacteria bacterium]